MASKLLPGTLLLALTAAPMFAQNAVATTETPGSAAAYVRVYDRAGASLVLAEARIWDEAFLLPRSALRGSLLQSGAQPAGLGVLTVVGPSTQTLTPAQFAAYPHTSLTVQNGHTHQSETYSGVLLITLLEKSGAPTGGDVKGKALSEYVVATGADQYKAVLALAEIEPAFHPGTVLVADTLAGKPLDAREGPFKLVVSEDAKPARSVHTLMKIELKQAE